MLVLALQTLTNWTLNVFEALPSFSPADPLKSLRQHPHVHHEEAPSSESHPLKNILTREWAERTIPRVTQIFRLVFADSSDLATHSQWKVREALVIAAGRFSLGPEPLQSSDALATLLRHSQDDFPSVAQTSRTFLNELLHPKVETSSSLPFRVTVTLRESLQTSIRSLPRIVRRANDSEIRATLRRVLGIVGLLGSKNQLDFLTSSLPQLLPPLFQTITFDSVQPSVRQTPFLGNVDGKEEEPLAGLSTWGGNYPRKHFRFFLHEDIAKDFAHLFRLWGLWMAPESLTNHLRDFLTRAHLSVIPQALFVFSQVLRGRAAKGLPPALEWIAMSPVSKPLSSSTIEGCLEALLSPLVWNCENLWGELLAVETLGNLLEVMEDVQRWEPQLLHPLMRKLGHPVPSIREAAFVTADRLRRIRGFSSLGEFVAEEADYLWDSLALQLSRSTELTAATELFQGILQFASGALRPLLRDALQLLLRAIAGQQHSPSVLVTLLQLLLSLVQFLARQMELSKKKEEEVKQLENEKGEEKENREEESGEGEEVEDVREALDQPKESLTVELLKHVRHFASIGDRDVRLKVLQIIREGLPVLHYEDNDFLPTVHLLWESLLPRFTDSDPLVAMAALEVLGVMSETAGDFLTSKVVQQLWPALQKNLQLPNTPKDEFSSALRLQRTLVDTLTRFVRHTDPPTEVVQQIALKTRSWLSDQVNVSLRQATLELWRELTLVDSDAIWWFLLEMKGFHFAAPSKRLATVSLRSNSSVFDSAVEQLLPK